MMPDNAENEFANNLRRYETPPDGFNPREGSASELRRYGYPRRPAPEAEPIFSRLWENSFDDRTKLIVPELSVDPVMSSRLSRKRRAAGLGQVDQKQFAASGWAGVVIPRPPDEPMTAVSGSWTVPNVASPGPLPPGRYTVGFWIGLDGFLGSNQVVQAGVAATIDVPDGFTTYWAWFEWFPAPPMRIDNFEVFYNDVITMTVCTPSTDHGFVSMKNQRTGVATSVGIPQPDPSVQSDGATAEWAVEATNGYLPYFSDVEFRDCSAGTKNHQLDLGSGYATTEITGNGRDLTSTTAFHHEIVALGQPPTVINNVDVHFLSGGN